MFDKTNDEALLPCWLILNAILPSLTNSKRSLKNTIVRYDLGKLPVALLASGAVLFRKSVLVFSCGVLVCATSL
jgi:hypothetical protein